MNITVQFDSIDEMIDFSNHFSTFPTTQSLEEVARSVVKPAPGKPVGVEPVATPTEDPASQIDPPADTTSEVDQTVGAKIPVKKLQGKQHVAEANKMIEANQRDPEIYPLLSDNQKQRVDQALEYQAERVETNRTEDKTPDELRQVIRSRIIQLQETGDASKLNAVRTALIETLDDQGTEYDRPKQSLVEEQNLADFSQKLTDIFEG